MIFAREITAMTRKKGLLILDDERSITFGLSRCLQSENVQVFCCNDPDSAKRAFAKEFVDAVIADVNLSPVNPQESLEFIQHVRSRNRQIPVIMMSGTDDMKSEALHEGATHFFQKPLDVDELIGLLHSLGFEVGPFQRGYRRVFIG